MIANGSGWFGRALRTAGPGTRLGWLATFVVVLLGTGASSVAAAAPTFRWINAAGGNWSTATNWDLGQAPTFGSDVVLPDLGASYQATLDVPANLGTLVIETDVRLRQGTDVGIPGLFCTGAVSIAGDVFDAGHTISGSSIHLLSTGTISLRVGEELTVGTASLTNDGVITLGSTDDTNLLFQGDVTIGGTGRILLSGESGIQKVHGSTAKIFHGAGHAIRGAGARIGVPMVNDGSVVAEAGLFSFLTVENHGVITASVGSDTRGSVTNTGGRFFIDGGRFSGGFNNAGGEIEIASGTFGGDVSDNTGGVIHLTGASGVLSGAINNTGGELLSDGNLVLVNYNLAGGTLDGSGVFTADGGSLTQVDLSGSADLDVIGSTGLFGPLLHHDGVVRVKNGGVLAIMADVTIEGPGAFLLEGGVIGGPRRLTNAAGHTISGFGTLVVALENRGLVLANHAATPLRVERDVTNTGALQATNGGVLRIVGAQVTNGGGVIAASGGSVKIEGGAGVSGGSIVADGSDVLLIAPGSTITGAELSRTGSSLFRNSSMAAVFTDVTLAPGAEVLNSGTLRVDGAGLTNHGLLRTTGTVEIASGASLLGDGVLALESGALRSLAGAVHQGAGHTIRGNGTIESDLVNAGTLQPGASPGAIHIEGDYQQLASGRLEIELAGTNAGAFDRLDVTGSTTLIGAFALSIIDGYAPVEGDAFQVMTFASRSGDFATYEGLSLAGGGTVVPFFTGVNDALYLRVIEGVLPVVGRELPKAIRFYAPRSGRGTELALELPETAEVSLSLFDLGGRECWGTTEAREAGAHRIRIGGRLAAGVYFARAVIHSAGATTQRSTRLVVLR